MSRRYRSKTWRKPAHWTEERYRKYLKENKLKRTSPLLPNARTGEKNKWH